MGFDVRPSRPLPVTLVFSRGRDRRRCGICPLVSRDVATCTRVVRRCQGPDQVGSRPRPNRAVPGRDVRGIAAAALGGYVTRRWSDHVGVEAVAASARGERRGISLRATGLRSLATWIVSSASSRSGVRTRSSRRAERSARWSVVVPVVAVMRWQPQVSPQRSRLPITHRSQGCSTSKSTWASGAASGRSRLR